MKHWLIAAFAVIGILDTAIHVVGWNLMIALSWHIFLVVWSTGCVVFAVRWRRSSDIYRLNHSVQEQVLQTRLAELQARERKALDA